MTVSIGAPRVCAGDELDLATFDEAFLSQFQPKAVKKFLSVGGLVLKLPQQDIKATSTDDISFEPTEVQPQAQRHSEPTVSESQKFSTLVTLLKLFAGFAQEFENDRDETFANIEDFKSTYDRRVSAKIPGLHYQAEAFRSTKTVLDFKLVTVGGGGGVRLDLRPTKKGTFSIALQPLYGEKRKMGALWTNRPYGQDNIWRGSAGVEYKHKLSAYAEPGFHVFFQPQIIDFEQFRVYAETFVKLKFVRNANQARQGLKISEIHLVPKIVYWKTTDESALWGDPLKDIFGEVYNELSSHLYAFCTLELRFRM